MSDRKPNNQRGNVSDRDREVMRKLGLAQAAANRDSPPPGTLRAALDAMHRIEQLHGIDPRDHIDVWADRESHLAYLDAVHQKMARDREIEHRHDNDGVACTQSGSLSPTTGAQFSE